MQDIWVRGAPTQEGLLLMLQSWCQQAEATGIQALEGARHSRQYAQFPINAGRKNSGRARAAR
ncbi:hypothetical protein [Thiocystis violacea]|uniref:DesA/ISL3 alpha bundle tail domain-containing protein n=1 Tax=Thiocystis violacea TaxID=13725 RepID=UPI0019089272|nr:hypothetical protein [Thiocystis violacea]